MTPLHSVPTSIPPDKAHTEWLTEQAVQASKEGNWGSMVDHLGQAAFAGMIAQGVPYERARAKARRDHRYRLEP